MYYETLILISIDSASLGFGEKKHTKGYFIEIYLLINDM